MGRPVEDRLCDYAETVALMRANGRAKQAEARATAAEAKVACLQRRLDVLIGPPPAIDLAPDASHYFGD